MSKQKSCVGVLMNNLQGWMEVLKMCGFQKHMNYSQLSNKRGDGINVVEEAKTSD